MAIVFAQPYFFQDVINQQNCNWTSMAAREVWEKEFQSKYLSKVFKEADSVIQKAHRDLLDAGNLAKMPLERSEKSGSYPRLERNVLPINMLLFL